MATVQIGITVVGATAGAFGGASFAKHLAPLLAGVPWLQAYAEQVALAIVVGVISFLSLVLGELVPKSLALRSAEGYALIIARPMVWLSRAARPLVWFLTASSNVVLRIFGDRTNFTETRHSPEELQQIVDEAASAGTVHRTAGDIAARAMDFPDLTARHVMVPRARVVGLMRDASREELRRVVLEEGPHPHAGARGPGPGGGVRHGARSVRGAARGRPHRARGRHPAGVPGARHRARGRHPHRHAQAPDGAGHRHRRARIDARHRDHGERGRGAGRSDHQRARR